jgi:predicted transcriptional regulator
MIEERILAELTEAAKEHDDWQTLYSDWQCQPFIGIHLAVMVEPFLTYILEGKKTIESRFSKPLIAPFERIAVGDLVLLKAGPLVGSFRASSVECIKLTSRVLKELQRDRSEAICADDEFWAAREGKSYATLVGISDVRPLTPVRVSKSDRRGWLVLRGNNSATQHHEQLSLV